MTTGCVAAGWEVDVATGVLDGAADAEAVSGCGRVASGPAPVGRGFGVVSGVARGVVLIASGCPQLVSTKTRNKSLQQRTTSHICFRTFVLKLYSLQPELSIPGAISKFYMQFKQLTSVH
jgi:hypothetical protein